MQKENYQAKSKIKPSDKSGQLPEKEKRLQNKRTLRAKLRNKKTIKKFQDSVSSVLDTGKDAFPKEASDNAESREVKCDQCGELFDFIQTLNEHKFSGRRSRS